MSHSKAELILRIENLRNGATRFFMEADSQIPPPLGDECYYAQPDMYWKGVTPALTTQSTTLRKEAVAITQESILLCKRSLLTGEADLGEIKIIARKLDANLRLRRYCYSEAEVLHDEGSVLGYKPSSQEEKSPCSPVVAQKEFSQEIDHILSILSFADPELGRSVDSSGVRNEGSKYRSNTAFIIMWMDKRNPELEDVRDAVVSIFREYGISAVRADDIEHDGVISKKILNEIATCEFLFADLTGERPNVYYEVGFAHALGKRVTLFRKSGTEIHFDLAGYNCPAYENLRDLKEKLSKRLSVLTNKTR